MARLDEKLARIRSGRYRRADFILADAKDPDMGPSLTGCGAAGGAGRRWAAVCARADFLDGIKAVVEQNIVDIMLVSASNPERLVKQGTFAKSAVKPAIRAN